MLFFVIAVVMIHKYTKAYICIQLNKVLQFLTDVLTKQQGLLKLKTQVSRKSPLHKKRVILSLYKNISVVCLSNTLSILPSTPAYSISPLKKN